MTQQLATREDSGAVADYAEGVLGLIERAVRDKTVDVEKMDRLLSMQERVLANRAKREFNESFRSAKSEIGPVAKNKYNEQTKSGYANLEAVADAIDPIIDKYGFAPTFGTDISPLEGHYRVTCDLLHVGGHEKHYFADVPADNVGMKGNQNKTATHGFGSTMSYGRRYLKLLIFDVATTDDNDGNSRRREPTYTMIDAKQCAELRRLIAQASTTEEEFVAYIRCNTLPELNVEHFDRAKGILEKRVTAMGESR